MSHQSIVHEPDIDSQETEEWIQALVSVLETDGVERAQYLIERLIDNMRRSGARLPYRSTTAYVNTISEAAEKPMPGEPGIEHRIRSIIRWNALAMVIQANKISTEYGGHISSFASSASVSIRARSSPADSTAEITIGCRRFWMSSPFFISTWLRPIISTG